MPGPNSMAMPKPSKLDRVLRAQDEKREAERAKRETYAVVDVRDNRRCRCCARQGNPYATTTLGRLHHVHLLDASLLGPMSPENVYLGCWLCHALIHAKQLRPIGENANELLQFEIDEAAVVHVFGTDELPKHVSIVLPHVEIVSVVDRDAEAKGAAEVNP